MHQGEFIKTELRFIAKRCKGGRLGCWVRLFFASKEFLAELDFSPINGSHSARFLVKWSVLKDPTSVLKVGKVTIQ